MLEEALHAEVRFVSKISLRWILSFWRPCQLGGPKVASGVVVEELTDLEGTVSASICGQICCHASHVWLRRVGSDRHTSEAAAEALALGGLWQCTGGSLAPA